MGKIKVTYTGDGDGRYVVEPTPLPPVEDMSERSQQLYEQTVETLLDNGDSKEARVAQKVIMLIDGLIIHLDPAVLQTGRMGKPSEGVLHMVSSIYARALLLNAFTRQTTGSDSEVLLPDLQLIPDSTEVVIINDKEFDHDELTARLMSKVTGFVDGNVKALRKDLRVKGGGLNQYAGIVAYLLTLYRIGQEAITELE